jgi:hypothetical protein
MTGETIRELLQRHHFEPFEMHMSNGDVVPVRHPEMALVLKTNVIVGDSSSDKFAICALLHIANVRTTASGSRRRK